MVELITEIKEEIKNYQNTTNICIALFCPQINGVKIIRKYLAQCGQLYF